MKGVVPLTHFEAVRRDQRQVCLSEKSSEDWKVGCLPTVSVIANLRQLVDLLSGQE
jgi:hypothetical protein